MIIPQVADNHTRSGNLQIPEVCPVCQEPTEIKEMNDVKVLFCNNPSCSAKQIKNFAHFVSRDAMNIDGMSEATIEKFISAGILHTLVDLFKLEDHKELIEGLEGFGEKSYAKLLKSVEAAKIVRMENFIFSLAILNVGLSNARLLCKHFNYDLEAIRCAQVEDLMDIDGYGDVIARSLYDYFNDEDKKEIIDGLLTYITFEKVEENTSAQTLDGKVFVITGSLDHYENRKAMKAAIEALGGKVTGSVTGKTDFLINNNVASTSGKNKKAKELEVAIIDEAMFLEMIDQV